MFGHQIPVKLSRLLITWTNVNFNWILHQWLHRGRGEKTLLFILHCETVHPAAAWTLQRDELKQVQSVNEEELKKYWSASQVLKPANRNASYTVTWRHQCGSSDKKWVETFSLHFEFWLFAACHSFGFKAKANKVLTIITINMVTIMKPLQQIVGTWKCASNQIRIISKAQSTTASERVHVESNQQRGLLNF